MRVRWYWKTHGNLSEVCLTGERWRFNVFAIIVLFVLSYLLIQAVHSGRAYIDQYRLNATIDQWEKNKIPQTLDTWLAMETFAVASLRGDKHNVELINASGRLYAYRSARMATTRAQRLAFGRKAMTYYRQVTRLRPAWPYGWMNLATIKARQGKLDQEFKRALGRLLRLGPWEANTLPRLIQLSAYAWPHLDAAMRQSLLKYYLIAQKHRKKDVLNAVTDAKLLARYCAIVSQQHVKASFCP